MAIASAPAVGTIDPDAPYPISRRYAWVAFAMTFVLMLSDYLSRQVINAVFPFLKATWALTDTQLGSLVSIVALTIVFTSIPISIVADRFGRVKSAAAMALVWALATIACGLAESFTGLLIARALVGLGEAAYGSAGGAILMRAFPARLHSTVMSSFLSAAIIGSVLGVVLGGIIAQAMGWQMAFILMGIFGLVVAILFPVLVKEPPPLESADTPKIPIRRVLARLLTTPTIILLALATGFSVFVQATYIAWLPSYLNRYYALDPAKASMGTGLLIVCASIGMIVCGVLADRVSKHNPLNRLKISMAYCVILGLTLMTALSLEPGIVQFVLIGAGMSMSTSINGPLLAVAADVTPASNHATTFAIVALAAMLIGGAPGPFVAGWIADRTSLQTALLVAPMSAFIGTFLLFLATKTYVRDRGA